MANYVVGDIQGCVTGLMGLLKKIQFDPSRDTLWAVGDLVARGEDSLATLQLLYDLGDSFKAVLGNHDLHLLAICQGIKQAKPNDNLSSLLTSKDLPRYIDWLRNIPLARMIDDNTLMVHAGLYPKWSIKQCLSQAKKVSAKLKQDDYAKVLGYMYGSEPRLWSAKLSDEEKTRFTINATTRMRFLTTANHLEFSHKEKPNQPSNSFTPWFSVTNKKLKPTQRVVFGHWAALEGLFNHPQFIGLDTGFVWGGKMTALRLEDNQFFGFNNPQ